MKQRKNWQVWGAFVLCSLCLFLAGCSTQTGSGTLDTDTSGASQTSQTQESSETEENSTPSVPQESEGTEQSEAGEIPSSTPEESNDVSQPQESGHDSILPDISSDDAGFAQRFAANPLDSGYSSELENASTTQQMLEVSKKYMVLWKIEVEQAYQTLLPLLTGDAYDQVKQEQETWVEQTPSMMEQIEASGETGGTTAALDVLNSKMVYYRSRAASLYSQLYQVDPDFSFSYQGESEE